MTTQLTPALKEATQKQTDKMFSDLRLEEKNKAAAREQLLRIQLLLAKRPI